MAKILVSDSLAEEGRSILADDGRNEVVFKPDITPEDLLKEIGEYEALVIRSRSQVPAEVLRAGKQLKIVGRAGVGVDNVDIPAATECGIMIANAPDGNTVTTCEHAISLLMALVRNVPAGDATMKAGKWEKKKLAGVELFGKTLGVIGLGKIGQNVARRMQAFGMTIWGYDPYVSTEVAEKSKILLKTVDEIIDGADIITIHTPKTSETEGLFDAAALKRMKKSAFIVNAARGGIVDEAALVEALEQGEIAGAALDVYTSEPLPEDHPLRKAPNLVLTPHLGASTAEAQEKVAVQVAQQVVNCLAGREVTTALNAPAINPELLSKLGSSMELAERLGSFICQMACGKRVKKLEVSIAGDLLKHPTEPIVLSVLTGYLKNTTDIPINFVNARAKIEEHGIEVVEKTSDTAKDFLRLKTVTATLEDDEKIQVSGTVYAPNRPRIVTINDLRLDICSKGNLIVVYNQDQPGVIGAVGTVLGEANVNIGEISWGRDHQGGMAMTAIHADSAVDQATLDKLSQLPNVVSVRMIKL